jgi:arylformamidase
MNTTYIYLSHCINETTPSYGNQDKFISEEKSSISKGRSANSSKWLFSSNHLGTHIDVPKHFFDNGLGVSDYPAPFWIFNNISLVDTECREAKILFQEIVSAELSDELELLLIRTGYEQYRDHEKYWNDNPGLSIDLANYLREKYKKLRAVGFDFISLTSWKYREIGKEAHKQFLKNNTPLLIIEDMSLKMINNHILQVIVAPLRVDHSDGSPVTVIAHMQVR